MQLQKVTLCAFIRGFDSFEEVEAAVKSRGISPYLTVCYKILRFDSAEAAASQSHDDLIERLVVKDWPSIIADNVPIDIQLESPETNTYFLLMVDIHLPFGATGKKSPRLSKAAKRTVAAFVKSESDDFEKLVKDLDNLAVAILDSGKSKN